jgi:hypothetical protein
VSGIEESADLLIAIEEPGAFEVTANLASNNPGKPHQVVNVGHVLILTDRAAGMQVHDRSFSGMMTAESTPSSKGSYPWR